MAQAYTSQSVPHGVPWRRILQGPHGPQEDGESEGMSYSSYVLQAHKLMAWMQQVDGRIMIDRRKAVTVQATYHRLISRSQGLLLMQNRIIFSRSFSIVMV